MTTEIGESNADKKEANSNKKWTDESPINRIGVYINGALAFFTLGLFLFTGVLVCDNRKLIAVNERHMEISDSLSQQSITLNGDIAKFNGQIAEMETRAYITTPIFKFEHNANKLSIRIQNDGKTGAYAVRYFINGFSGNSEKTADSIEWYSQYGTGRGIDIGMGEHIDVSKIVKLHDGEKLFFYGYISYEDIFRQKFHTMRFFVKLDDWKDAWEGGPQNWEACQEYNDQDR